MTSRTYTTASAPFALPSLQWVLAFEAAQATGTVRYGIYFDTNHVAVDPAKSCPQVNPDPGGPADPLNHGVFTEALYKPEYVIYVDWNGSAITQTSYSRWNGIRWLPNCQWDPPKTLAQIGGDAWYDPATHTFQLLVPYTALGAADDDFAGSVAMTVFSTSFAPGDGLHDSVPPQGAQIDNPAFVSDMLMPLYPFDTSPTNPIVHLDMPPLRWRMPVFDSVDGYQVQVARDSRFTDLVATWETYETQTSPFFALLPATFQGLNAYADNESYYWRVRIRHERFVVQSQFYDYGPWSPPLRLKLDSRTIQNPALSTVPDVYMTPAFLWDRIEGAAGYTIQIDNDQNFSSPLISQATDATSYTPEEDLASKALVPFTKYYWRVAMRRSDTVIGRWSETQVFSKTSTIPTPLAPLTGTEVFVQPLFQWTAVLTPSVTSTPPRLAAPRYRLQVDDELSFQSPALNELTEATAYTPPKGKALADGTWYWRVALVDANGNPGPYSPVQRIFKQYPVPRLISPVQNAALGGSPTFVWEAVPGAAYYRIDVADNEGFANLFGGETVNTTLTATRDVGFGSYFWRVRMYDQDRNPGPVVRGNFTLGNVVYLPLVRR
jgi:hypothetical protein